MIRHRTAPSILFLFGAIAAGTAHAEFNDVADAVANYAVTDPATGKTGTARATATAVISENMVIQYVTPMSLGISGEPGGPETLRLIAANKASGRPEDERSGPPLSASLAVQGLPNQTFAVSIDQATRGANGSGGPVVATFTHSAGQTPHIGPAGGTEFVIAATLHMARNTARNGYSGALDVIVSHN
ncbi:MAG: DUF4402 domain-containing protein [Proteobacteria bacterium]|nr:DUF4402 domain-containing protein [Pseudomonadota bacterium]